MADSTKSPTSVDNDSSEILPWTDPSNAKTSDNSYATNAINIGQSDGLIAVDFDFAIPAGATINGIVLSIERKSSRTLRSKDYLVQLTKDGVNGATASKADTTTTYGTSDATISYGGATDTWGISWTAEEVNSDTFGSIFQCTCTSLATVSVDAFTVKVYYTEAAVSYSAVIMVQSS
jgi:hypothetical protein